MELAYFKYRQLFAWGNQDWNFIAIDKSEIDKDFDLEEWLESRGLLSNWSDKWRGVEHKRLTKLPKYVLNRKIQDARDSLRAIQAKVEALLLASQQWYNYDLTNKDPDIPQSKKNIQINDMVAVKNTDGTTTIEKALGTPRLRSDGKHVIRIMGRGDVLLSKVKPTKLVSV